MVDVVLLELKNVIGFNFTPILLTTTLLIPTLHLLLLYLLLFLLLYLLLLLLYLLLFLLVSQAAKDPQPGCCQSRRHDSTFDSWLAV